MTKKTHFDWGQTWVKCLPKKVCISFRCDFSMGFRISYLEYAISDGFEKKCFFQTTFPWKNTSHPPPKKNWKMWRTKFSAVTVFTVSRQVLFRVVRQFSANLRKRFAARSTVVCVLVGRACQSFSWSYSTFLSFLREYTHLYRCVSGPI